MPSLSGAGLPVLFPALLLPSLTGMVIPVMTRAGPDLPLQSSLL
jgi:hypothetical protein